jgi:hypothetical protein
MWSHWSPKKAICKLRFYKKHQINKAWSSYFWRKSHIKRYFNEICLVLYPFQAKFVEQLEKMQVSKLWKCSITDKQKVAIKIRMFTLNSNGLLQNQIAN